MTHYAQWPNFLTMSDRELKTVLIIKREVIAAAPHWGKVNKPITTIHCAFDNDTAEIIALWLNETVGREGNWTFMRVPAGQDDL